LPIKQYLDDGRIVTMVYPKKSLIINPGRNPKIVRVEFTSVQGNKISIVRGQWIDKQFKREDIKKSDSQVCQRARENVIILEEK